MLIPGDFADAHKGDFLRAHETSRNTLWLPARGLAKTQARGNSARYVTSTGALRVPPQTVKLLHTADLHLDSPLKSLALKDASLRERVATASREALEGLVAIAIDEGVEALLIAGDLFDGDQRSAKTAAFMARIYDRLGEAGIRVFAIRGNHDATTPATNAIAPPPHVHVFDGHGGKVQLGAHDIWIHGVSFRKPKAPESLLPRFAAPVAGAVNVGLLHTSLGGAVGHDTYAPCRLSDLAAHGFDYWGLGHIHKRTVHSRSPWIVMPGTPQGRDIGEDGTKSATLITITDGRIAIEERPSAAVEFRRSECDVTGLETAEAVQTRLASHLAAEAQAITAPSAILRLRLSGETPLAWEMSRSAAFYEERARDFAKRSGALWIEKLEMGVSPPDAQRSAGPTAELAALMEDILTSPAFQAEAHDLLAQALQVPGMPAGIATSEEDEAALATRLGQSGMQALIARMRGGV